MHDLALHLALDADAPGLEGAIRAVDRPVTRRPVDASRLELARLRAYRLRDRAPRLFLDARDARGGGLAERRVGGLAVCREGPECSPRERAAPARTVAGTLVADGQACDAVHAAARVEPGDDASTTSTPAIAATDGRNRLAVGLRARPHRDTATAA